MIPDAGYSRVLNSALDNSLQRAVEGAPSARQSTLDSALTNNLTAMQRVGVKVDIPNVSDALVKGSSLNKQNNVAAQTTSMQLDKAQGNFTAQVQKVHNSLDDAMKQATTNLGMDHDSAKLSFHAPHVTDHYTAAGSLAVDMMTPGYTALVTAAMQAVGDIKAERGKLSPEQEARLADEMFALLSPKRDMRGNVVAPPSIPNDLDLEEVQPHEMRDLVKQLFLPPEQQPEGKQMANVRHQLDHEVLPRHTEAGQENEAEQAVSEGWSEAELVNAQVCAAGEMLGCYSGVKPQGDGILGAVGEALAALHNEFNPRVMGLDNNPKPGMLGA